MSSDVTAAVAQEPSRADVGTWPIADDINPDEKTTPAVPLLRDAVAYYVRRGLKVRRALTDNSAVFRLRDVANACDDLSILHEINRAQWRRTSSQPGASSSRHFASERRRYALRHK